MGLGRKDIFFQVLLPSSLISIVNGLRIGLANGWRVLIAAEMVVGVAVGRLTTRLGIGGPTAQLGNRLTRCRRPGAAGHVPLAPVVVRFFGRSNRHPLGAIARDGTKT